ncbi:hypothetical protein L6R29_02485 [Myxococcota bacterium]|nr:hypothetical protein [Myxococcota bacterium]
MLERRRWCGLWCALALLGSWWGAMGVVKAESGPSSRPTNSEKIETLREVRVYVPYHRLGQVMKEEGVFLSREQYSVLMDILKRWQKQRSQQVPVSAVLTHATYRVRVQGEQVLLEADLALRVLRDKGWVRVSLPFQGLPLWTAHLDGKPALLFSSARQGGTPHLLVQGAGVHKLHLVFQGQAKRQGGWREAQISIPPTPQTQLQISVQGKGLQMSVNGESAPLVSKGDEATATLQLGPQSALLLRWFPRQQVQTGSRTILSAQTQLDCVLSEGALRMRADIGLRILRGGQDTTEIHLPAGNRLISVDAGGQLLRWRTRKHNDAQILVLLWRKTLKGSQSLRLEFEQIWPKTPERVEIPKVRVEGAAWQHGGIALRVDGALQIKIPAQQGVNQIDPEEYARINKTSAPQQAFSYLSTDYSLTVTLEKIQPRLRGRVAHQLQLDEEQAMLWTNVAFQIERAGVDRLRFRIPADWKLLQVTCPSMEDHYLEGKDTLVVTLKDKIGGPVQIRQVSAQQLWATLKHQMGWDLLQQIGSSESLLRERLTSPRSLQALQRLFGRVRYQSGLVHRCQVRMQRKHTLADTLAIPLIEPLGLESERGEVGLLLPRHLDLETEGLKGLMSVEDIDEVAALGRGGRYPLRQAFRYVGRPAEGKVKLRRKATAIEAQAWLPVQLREDGYRIEGTLRYQVRFAGTKQLQFTVSSEVAKRIQITTIVRETRKEEKQGKTTYTLLMDRRIPRDAHFLVSFTYAYPFKKAMDVGALRDVVLPAFVIPGALRQEVYWGLKKEESLSLQDEETRGITRVDVSDIPSFASGTKVSRVLRSREKEPPALKIYLRRHRYAQVLSAVVPVMHIEAVVNMEGEVQVLAMAQIRNRGRQFLKVKLPQEAQVLSLRVAERDRYRFELDAKGELLVDLVQRNDGQVFPLIVRYRHALPNKTRLDQWSGSLAYQGPILVDTPVLRSTLRLHLPKNPSYVAYDTSMWHRLNVRGMWQILREALWVSAWDGGFWGTLSGEYAGLVGAAGEMSTQFPRRAKYKAFVSRSGNVRVNVAFRSPWLQWALELAAFLVMFVVLLVLGSPLQQGIQRLRLATFAFLLLLFGSSLLPVAWVHLLYSASVSVAMLSVGWMGIALFRNAGERWQMLVGAANLGGDDRWAKLAEANPQTAPSPSASSAPKTAPSPSASPLPTIPSDEGDDLAVLDNYKAGSATSSKTSSSAPPVSTQTTEKTVAGTTAKTVANVPEASAAPETSSGSATSQTNKPQQNTSAEVDSAAPKSTAKAKTPAAKKTGKKED